MASSYLKYNPLQNENLMAADNVSALFLGSPSSLVFQAITKFSISDKHAYHFNISALKWAQEYDHHFINSF